MARGHSSLTTEFLRAERALRAQIRCRRPVVVYLRSGQDMGDDAGCSCLAIQARPLRQVVVADISADMTAHEAIETLIHEYAHAAAWGRDRDPHGPEWGKAYSRCYRVVVYGKKRRKAK